MRISDWSSDVCSSDLLAPFLVRSWTVGAARSRRVASVTLPPDIGTLKSTRTSTVLTATSRSSRVLNFGIGVSLKGSGWRLARRSVATSARRGKRQACVPKRSEESQVGKECVRTCRSRWSPQTEQKKTTDDKSNYKTAKH